MKTSPGILFQQKVFKPPGKPESEFWFVPEQVQVFKYKEEGIRKTDEIRNTKNIRQIKGGFKNPTRQIFENRNLELFKKIKDFPIVDKLYTCLNEFNDFRRIISWRLIDKIAKRENPILYFFVKYNQKILAFKTIDYKYPDLDIILDTLDISDENYGILKSIASNSLYNSYAQSVDETYLKLKDYKQRYEINDTADAIRKQNASIAEFTNFFDGNWLVTNGAGESDLLYEKVIESCVISYSMNTEHSYHLNSFNDFLVQISIHHCNSNKLLGYFQRNSVRSISYKSEIILKRIAKNKEIKNLLKEVLSKQYDKELSKSFVNYFTD